MTSGLSAVVASCQDTLPGTAQLSMSGMEQELLGSPQETINNQASEFLMSAWPTLPVVSDPFDYIVREDLFVAVNHSCFVVKGRLRENIAFWQNIGASKWLERVNRLIVELCFVNQHYPSRKFKYEDILTAADLF